MEMIVANLNQLGPTWGAGKNTYKKYAHAHAHAHPHTHARTHAHTHTHFCGEVGGDTRSVNNTLGNAARTHTHARTRART